MTSDAIQVCIENYEVLSIEKVRETFDLIQKGTPIITHPALWWAPERIYGVPDLIVHTSWLKDKFPSLLNKAEEDVGAKSEDTNKQDYYVVFDLKFTSNLNESNKAKDLLNYTYQMRIYSYILGNLQGFMPQNAYLITRDRTSDPLPVNIKSALNQPLDEDISAIRERFLEIKLNGSNYLPWQDSIVESNISHQDDKWYTAKNIIAQEKVLEKILLYYIKLALMLNVNLLIWDFKALTQCFS